MPNTITFTPKQARMYAGYTKKEMGEFLGICKDTYSAKECQPGKFSVAEGKKISLKTGIPMDLIIF